MAVDGINAEVEMLPALPGKGLLLTANVIISNDLASVVNVSSLP